MPRTRILLAGFAKTHACQVLDARQLATASLRDCTMLQADRGAGGRTMYVDRRRPRPGGHGGSELP